MLKPSPISTVVVGFRRLIAHITKREVTKGEIILFCLSADKPRDTAKQGFQTHTFMFINEKMGNKKNFKHRTGLGTKNKIRSKGIGPYHVNPILISDWLKFKSLDFAFYWLFWPSKVQTAVISVKTGAQIEPSTSRESEQVRETGEDYLEWYMNQTAYDVVDQMDELDDSIEKACS